MASKENVELGFCEKTDAWRLKSHFFPSKVGGRPAWLSLKPLPKPDDLKCSSCGQCCVFLMQVYSPLQEEESFHRTLFVFVCRNSACCERNSARNFLAFRSQLPKNNEFFSSTPPDDGKSSSREGPSAEQFGSLCAVCGCEAPFGCGKCKNVKYCSKEHQAVHWKAGHKASCGQSEDQTYTKLLFPEFDLVTESEEFSEEEDDDEEEEEEKTEEEKMKEFEEFKTKHLKDKEGKYDTETLEKMAASQKADDKQFNKFKKRIQIEPEQVLRYKRGDDALWVSSESIPLPGDIPHCSCGSQRHFEFQILPQLLTHLNVDQLDSSLDWGTLVIYTCRDNCAISGYNKEFVWKQDFSATDCV